MGPTTARTITVIADANGVARFPPGNRRCFLLIGPTTPATWQLQFGSGPDLVNGVGSSSSAGPVRLTKDEIGDAIDSEFTVLIAATSVVCAIEVAYQN